MVVQITLALVWQPATPVIPRFEEFRAQAFEPRPPVDPDVTGSRLGRAYRTRIRAGATTGPNFAGHFTLVAWGCGSSCQEWAIIDARTGQVFDWLIRSTAGAEFYPDSRLLIVDSPKKVAELLNGEVPARCAVCGTPDAFEWTGSEWRALPGFDAGRIRKY